MDVRPSSKSAAGIIPASAKMFTKEQMLRVWRCCPPQTHEAVVGLGTQPRGTASGPEGSGLDVLIRELAQKSLSGFDSFFTLPGPDLGVGEPELQRLVQEITAEVASGKLRDPLADKEGLQELDEIIKKWVLT